MNKKKKKKKKAKPGTTTLQGYLVVLVGNVEAIGAKEKSLHVSRFARGSARLLAVSFWDVRAGGKVLWPSSKDRRRLQEGAESSGNHGGIAPECKRGQGCTEIA
jgi:hypothetical protein